MMILNCKQLFAFLLAFDISQNDSDFIPLPFLSLDDSITVIKGDKAWFNYFAGGWPSEQNEETCTGVIDDYANHHDWLRLKDSFRETSEHQRDPVTLTAF